MIISMMILGMSWGVAAMLLHPWHSKIHNKNNHIHNKNKNSSSSSSSSSSSNKDLSGFLGFGVAWVDLGMQWGVAEQLFC